MDVIVVGFILTISSVVVDITYAVDRRVIVTDDLCNRTYHINKNERIIMSFTPNKLFTKDQPGYHTFKRCIFPIVNTNEDFPICIKSHGMGNYANADLFTCDLVLRYFIGYLPFHLLNGYTCSNFRWKPKCTTRQKVYVVFENAYGFPGPTPVEVELYAKENGFHTVSTKRWSEGRTTTYWYSTNNNDDDDGEPIEPENSVGILLKAAFGLVIFLILFCICCAWVKFKVGIADITNTERQQVVSEPTNTERQQPVSEPQNYTTGQPTYTDEVPPYSVVMQQQQLYSGEEDKIWQIHDPVYHVAEPNAANALLIPENHPQRQNQPGTNHPSDEQARNQIIPTAPPPPPYCSDLPPPYPGC